MKLTSREEFARLLSEFSAVCRGVMRIEIFTLKRAVETKLRAELLGDEEAIRHMKVLDHALEQMQGGALAGDLKCCCLCVEEINGKGFALGLLELHFMDKPPSPYEVLAFVVCGECLTKGGVVERVAGEIRSIWPGLRMVAPHDLHAPGSA